MTLPKQPIGSVKSTSITHVTTDGETLFKSDVPVLHTKIIDIGDWNMDSSTNVSVAHGLSNYKLVRFISAVIRNDADTEIGFIPSVLASATASSDRIRCYTTNVVLNRSTGGVFDNANHDSTSYNRGWITIQYVDG